jgi:hypothetical protein
MQIFHVMFETQSWRCIGTWSSMYQMGVITHWFSNLCRIYIQNQPRTKQWSLYALGTNAQNEDEIFKSSNLQNPNLSYGVPLHFRILCSFALFILLMVLPSNSIIHCRQRCKFWVVHNEKRQKFLSLLIGQRWFSLCLHKGKWWHCVCKRWTCERSKVTRGDVAINAHDVLWLLVTNENHPSCRWQ